VKIVPNAVTNGAVSPTSAWCGTRPMITAVTATYSRALAAVPSTDAHPTFRSGLRTRAARYATAMGARVQAVLAWHHPAAAGQAR
jgi:hypothetical protein